MLYSDCRLVSANVATTTYPNWQVSQMNIDQTDLTLLRECAADDEAYYKLVAYFATVVRLPPNPSHTASHEHEDGDGYRLVAQHMHDMVVLHNNDRTIRYASPSTTRVIGYTPEEVRTLPPNSLVHPDDMPRLVSFMEQQDYHGDLPRLTYRLRHKDGHYLWVESEVTLIFDADGAFDCFLVSTRDISDRKATEEALRRSEANLRAMLNSTHQSFTLIDRDGCVVDADEGGKQSALAIFGRRIEPGDDIRDFVLPAHREGFERNYVRALAGEVIHVEREFPSQTGDLMVFTVSYYPVMDDTGAIIGVCMSHQDITESKLREQELQAAAANLYALLDATQDVAFLMQTDGTVLAANEALAHNLGLASPRDVIGQSIYAYIPGDIGTVRHGHLEAAIATGQPQRFTDERAGRTLANVIVPIKDDDGSVTRLAVYAQDITERIQHEAALTAAHDALRRLIAQLPVGVQLFDTNGNCTEVNAALLRVFGTTQANLIDGYNILEDPLAEAVGTASAFRRALAGETVHLGDLDFDFALGDSRFAVGEGTRIINVSIVPIFDEEGLVVRVVGVNTDITERKHNEELLRRTQQYYENLANSITDYFYALDENLCYTFWNSAAEQLTGIPASVAIGASLYDLFPYVRGTDIEATYREVLASGQTKMLSFSYEIAGEMRHYEMQVYPSPQGISSINKDVTDRRVAEQKAFDLALEKERVRLLGQFIKDASHEFRTPLSTISTGAYLMTHYDERDKREAKAAQMQAQVERLTRLLDMLLLMARLESGDTSPLESLEIGLIVRDVCNGLEAEYGMQPTLVRTLADDLPPVQGQRSILELALHQLLDNAYRYTAPEGTITVTAQAVAEGVQVEISDTGTGIPSEILPHIFKTFWRHDQPHTTPGLGLGLPIAQRIVQRHGGDIGVVSSPGAGSRFTVTLPAAPETEAVPS